jgi:hypothetical protein
MKSVLLYQYFDCVTSSNQMRECEVFHMTSWVFVKVAGFVYESFQIDTNWVFLEFYDTNPATLVFVFR